MARHAVVTVVFEPEVPLLELQLRSLQQLAPTGLLEEVVVIDNTRRGLAPAVVDGLAAGMPRHRLRVLRPGDVVALPAAGGWRRQQLLKLFVARRLGAERYLVLDAKNHLVGPLTTGFLEDRQGRPRHSAHGFEGHPLRPALERTVGFFGLDAAPRVARYPATVTPVVLETACVLDLLDRLVPGPPGPARDRAFVRTFLDHDLTEFFLCSAWLEHRGEDLADVLDLSRDRAPVVWPKGTAPDSVRATLASATGPFFGVHRRALATLPPDSRDLLAAFLTDRGLFADRPAADAWLGRARAAAAARDAWAEWLSVPGRAVAAARRRHAAPGRSGHA